MWRFKKEKNMADKKTANKKSQATSDSKNTKVAKTDSAEHSAEQNVKENSFEFSIPLDKMLEAGVHFGHLVRRWHPKMKPFIWQAKDGVHIFDLLKTQKCLNEACQEAKKLVSEGKTILFVGTKRQASAIVKEEAKRAGVFYIVTRWPGGLLSNWEQIQKSIKRYNDLKEGLAKGKFNQYTKKERVLLDKEMVRLERLFGGIIDMKRIPDALFIVDILREKSVIKESRNLGLKIFALADSNADPDMADYIIPCNDDAVRSIKLLVEKFADAVIAGKALASKKQEVNDNKAKASK